MRTALETHETTGRRRSIYGGEKFCQGGPVRIRWSLRESLHLRGIAKNDYPDRQGGNLRAQYSTSSATARAVTPRAKSPRSARRSSCTTPFPRGSVLSQFSPNDLREAEQFPERTRAATAASPTSTSAPVRRRDRGSVRRRKGHRRRPGVRLGRLESLHAPPNQHDQLGYRAAVGTGNQVW